MRVFLTGATGFIGSHLLRDLLARGHEVAVLLRDPDRAEGLADVLARTTIVQGSLADLAAIAPAMAEFAADTVIHCAWDGVAGAARNDPRQIANYAQALELVSLAAATGARTWIGVGSQAEYGSRLTRRPREDGPAEPETLYGAAKLSTCVSTRVACHQAGLRFAWMRVFSTFGPGDAPHWMVPSLILRLLRGERPALTAAEQVWDYLHVDDAAAAIRHVAETASCAGIYNLGSGRARPLRTIVETIRDLIDPALPLGFGEVPYRTDQVMHLEADISRLTDAGWSPRLTLEAGLADTVDWYRRHRCRFEPSA